MQFDEKPVCGERELQVSDSTLHTEDFSKFSTQQLLLNSNWKARREGYKKVTHDAKRWREIFFDSLPQVTTESNAAAQEELLKALVAVVHFSQEEELDILCTGSLTLALEKGLLGRPKAIEASQQFVSLLVENGKHEEVFKVLLSFMAHKTPKNRLAATQLCAALVHDFGVQNLPLKHIMRMMQPLFNDANMQVRKEAINLCCQCYQYMGASIRKFLINLRDVQLQELEKQFQNVVIGTAPSRKIKGTQPSTKERDSNTMVPVSSLLGKGIDTNVDDETFQLLDESSVLSKLPRNFFEIALEKSAKWQDKCTFVSNTLLPLLQAPRLRAKDDYHELANMMRVYLSDPQAPLMLLGFRMTEECARGLRADFAPYARSYLNILFDKMKDKKTSVLEHVMRTLEKLIQFRCITMDQCNDDIEQVSQSKNPSQRLALMHFCVRMVDKLESSQYAKLAKSTAMLRRMVNDDKAENRDVAYALLTKLSGVFGESLYKSVLASMDDKQLNRMRIVASNTASNATLPINTQATTPSSSPAKKIQRVEEGLSLHAAEATESGLTVTSRMSPGYSGPPHTSPSLSSSTHTSARLVPPPLSPPLEDWAALESTLPPTMESSNKMLGLTNGDTTILDLLRSHEWSQRYDGVLKVKATVMQWSPAECASYFDVLVVYLRAYPGWKESTFQVFQAVLGTLTAALSKAPSITHGAGYAIVNGCTARLTELKNRQPVKDICQRIAQYLGWRFVLKHMMSAASRVATPKLLQECNGFFVEIIENLILDIDGNENKLCHLSKKNGGSSALDVKAIMSYLKKPCFEQSALPVRVTSLRLLCVLSRYAEPIVRRHLSFFSAQIVSAYEQEMQKESFPGKLRVSVREDASIQSTEGTIFKQTVDTTNTSTSVSHTPLEGALAQAQKFPRTTNQFHQLQYSKQANRHSSRSHEGEQSRVSTVPLSSMSEFTSSAVVQTESNFNDTPRESTGGGSTAEISTVLRLMIRAITEGGDWRDRLNAIHQVEECLRQVQAGTLAPNTVTTLLAALGGRLDESNKNFVVDVLRVIPLVVSAGGRVESKVGLRRLLPTVTAMLGDQKAALREEARNVVFLAVDVVGLDGLLPCLQKPLSSDSSMARQNALEALQYGFANLSQGATVSKAVLHLLVPFITNALMDRISEVRAVGEQVVGHVLPITGEEVFIRFTQRLKPADQQAIFPAIERQIQLRSSTNPSLLCASSSANAMPHPNKESSQVMPTPPASTVESTHFMTANSMKGHKPSGSSRSSHVTSGNTDFDSRIFSLAVIAVSQTPPAKRTTELHTNKVIPSKTQGREKPPSFSLSVPYPNENTDQNRNATQPDAVVEEGSVKDKVYATQEIVIGLRSASTSVAYAMCTDFMKHLREGEDCGTPEMMQAMMERLHENARQLETDLALGLIGCLSAMFAVSRSAKRCHSNLLFRLLGDIFDCLLSSSFSINETVLKSLNNMTLRMLEGCAPNEVFSALLSRMTSYSTTYLRSGSKSDLKYIQVTVKCIMRLDLEHVLADNVILCCHEYLLQHPPSAFKNLDDLPIRTVKTLLQAITQRLGSELLNVADRLIGPQNLVIHFIRACLENHDRTERSKNQNERLAAEENKQQQKASMSPSSNQSNSKDLMKNPKEDLERLGAVNPSLTHVDPAPIWRDKSATPQNCKKKATQGVLHAFTTSCKPNSCDTDSTKLSTSTLMTNIFSRIRNHVTSHQGIEELYMLFKHPSMPSEDYEKDFNFQFLRCTKEFQWHIKRKLDLIISEDKEVPQCLQLPKILQTF